MFANKFIKNHSGFCNISWRKYITEVCNGIDEFKVGFQVISPFGFELLEDKNFLHKSLKRFYCYIGIPKNKVGSGYDIFKVSQIFADKLLSTVHKIGIHQSDIAVLVIQDRFELKYKDNYKCRSSDKLIDIQTRIIEDNILHDYAKYIICSIDSVCSKKDEPRYFFENKRHRCRTYQLYIMLEKIFGYLLPAMDMFQKENFSNMFKLIDNSLQMFYTPSKLLVKASDFECHIMNSLIQPRVELIQQLIKHPINEEKLIKIKCGAYHVNGTLDLLIHKKIYEKAINKICSTYLKFY